MNFFEQSVENTLEVIGTVREIIGAKGKVTFSENNLRDESKAVTVLLTNEKGQQGRAYCSAAVSKGLRDKTISAGEFMSLNVAPGETKEGVAIFRVIRPQGATLVLEGAKIKDKKFSTKSTLVPEDLIAF